MNLQDTIVAVATGQGNGAIGVIRLSGDDAFLIANSIFKSKKENLDLNLVKSQTLHFGEIVDGENTIDEVLISVFKNPNSYTGENLIEISCHASNFIQQQIVNQIIKKGARLAAPGEFTFRAFKNGKMDLSQAEAVADLIASETQAEHHIALNQMRGGFSTELQKLRDELIHFTALIELELDFSEEDVEFADRSELEKLIQKIKTKSEKLIHTFEYGNAIKNGVPVAIVGKPNAGKSTLLNALLNEERAIVSDIAGTTRDTIEETLNIDGVTFRFIDTAGIRETGNEIEAIGVEKAKEKIRQAKVVLHLYENDLDILREIEPLLEDKIVFNLLSKIDINDWANDRYENYLFKDYPHFHHFGISVKTGFNLELLKTELIKSIRKGVDVNSIIISNLRHKNALQNAVDSFNQIQTGLKNGLPGDLLSFHLRNALKQIGSITGEIDVDKDILGTVFGKFCIGK